MEELELLSKIVRTLSTGLKVPVTCKTRIYKNDFQRTIKLCETLVDAGASMLTIHGRTREEKGNLVAQADWEMIAKIKAHFAGRVPVIANGGIENMDDVAKCLEATGADGIM
jgi:tRNA-dihydrouridine synthase 1